MDPQHLAQSPALFGYSRRIWSELAPKDVIGGRMRRVGGDFDGGYIMLESHLNDAVAYSFGIGDEISWDLAMTERGTKVFQYDHTIDRFPGTHPLISSFSIGLASRRDVEGLKTIEQLISDNGHLGRRDIILKCDVEGAEWEAFETIPHKTMDQFSQIVVEFHDFQDIGNIARMNRRMNVLARIKETHQPIHVHANNWHDPIMLGGVMMPNLIEVTYVRRKDHDFQLSSKVYPTDIDQPGSPFKPDIFLGAIGHLG